MCVLYIRIGVFSGSMSARVRVCSTLLREGLTITTFLYWPDQKQCFFNTHQKSELKFAGNIYSPELHFLLLQDLLSCHGATTTSTGPIQWGWSWTCSYPPAIGSFGAYLRSSGESVDNLKVRGEDSENSTSMNDGHAKGISKPGITFNKSFRIWAIYMDGCKWVAY